MTTSGFRWSAAVVTLVLACASGIARSQAPVWTKPAPSNAPGNTPAPAPTPAVPAATPDAAPATPATPSDPGQAQPVAPVAAPATQAPAGDNAVPPVPAAQGAHVAPAPPRQAAPVVPVAPTAERYPTRYAPVAAKKGKLEYFGPKTVVELTPTPMLDEEGRQRLDPDGKPMFNPPVRQQRDKKGNPVFDDHGQPVMQTPNEMGYDDKGKKLHDKKVKPPKMVSVSIERGTLTVDGLTGKAGMNYEIKNLKYIYLYAPWIGVTVVSTSQFPGAQEQKNAFNDKTLTINVEDHTMQLYSDKRMLGKKPESAFVAVDRNFKLPSKFPVVGYGETLKPPYAWPGSKENAALKGPVAPPPLPPSLRATALLQPCPPGQMREPGKTPLPGENLPPAPCVAIQKALPGVGAPKPVPPANAPNPIPVVATTPEAPAPQH